jgi:tetratricopeptide (TPR) repeat protein
VIALVLASVASGLFYRFTGEGRVVGLGFEPLWFPHEAVKFSGRPEMPPRFASFSFGWAPLYSYHFGPDRKVFIDPRLEVAGPDLYERYVDLERRITLKAPGWPEALDALERPVILIGHAGLSDPGEMARTGVALLAHPRWELVYFDPQASVYVHDSYQEVVRSHRVDLQARHFGRDRRSEPQGTVALLAGARSLWSYALGLQEQGRLDLVQTVIPLGLDYARRVLASEPENPNAWKLFGLLLAAREVPSESPVARYRQPFDPLFDLTAVRATAALRHALELKPDDFVLQFQLALTYQSRQMTEAAQPLIDALLDRPPMNPLQIRLQDSLRAQRGPQLSPIVPGRFRNRNELEQQVNSLLAEGRADSVAQVLEREFPPEARSWPLADRLATIRLHLGQPKQARLIWEAVADPPRPALQAARIAVTHFAEGDYEAAGRHYRKALMLEPDLFEAHYGLARLKADAGRASESAAAAEGAVACAPSEVARTSAQLLLDSVAPYR